VGDSGGVVGGWVGKVSKKIKNKRVGGGEKIKFEKKTEIREKYWEGGREKIKLQKK
jgi:hypothetical protein